MFTLLNSGVLLNLTEDKDYHSLLVSGGFLHLLASWIRSDNNELKSLGKTPNYYADTHCHRDNTKTMCASDR